MPAPVWSGGEAAVASGEVVVNDYRRCGEEVVVLALDGLQGGGLAKLQAIGDKLDAVRASGKKVIAQGSSKRAKAC